MKVFQDVTEKCCPRFLLEMPHEPHNVLNHNTQATVLRFSLSLLLSVRIKLHINRLNIIHSNHQKGTEI